MRFFFFLKIIRVKLGIIISHMPERKNEGSKRTETREHAEPKEAKELIPKEFLFHKQFVTKPDRNGVTGTIDVQFDTRPASTNLFYLPINLREDVGQVFFDDIIRSLNEEFAGGGRDMRSLSFDKLSPEVHKQREERIAELRREIENLTKEKMAALPFSKITLDISRNENTQSGKDEEGRYSHTYVTKLYRWLENPQEYRTGLGGARTTISQESLTTESSYNAPSAEEIEKIEQSIQKGNGVATAFLHQRLAELKEKEKDPEIASLQKRLEEAYRELGIFEGTVTTQIPVFLSKGAEKEEDKKEIETLRDTWPGLLADAQHTHSPKTYPYRADAEYGSAGTEKWYAYQGIDPAATSIDFRQTRAQITKRMFDLENLSKERALKEKQAEKLAAEKATLAQEEKRKNELLEAARLKKELAEQSLTPETRKAIGEKLSEAQALSAIFTAFSPKTSEQEKFKRDIPFGILPNLEQQYKNGNIGSEALDTIDKYVTSLKTLSERKKIHAELPALFTNAEQKLTAWKDVPSAVKKSADAQMVINEGLITQDDLIQQVRSAFLAQPWDKTPQEIMSNIVDDLIEKLEV